MAGVAYRNSYAYRSTLSYRGIVPVVVPAGRRTLRVIGLVRTLSAPGIRGPTAMTRILLRTGYDFVSPKLVARIDGVAQDLSTATIEASIKSEDKLSELVADTAQTDTGDADWANGEVVIRFPLASLASVTLGRAWIEVAVVLGGLRLPYEDIPIVVEKGWAT